MSSLNQLFTSFIKGIAKTTGSLTVLSVAAILWQLYTNENITILPFKSKSNPEPKGEEAEPKGEEADLECSFIDCNNHMENENTFTEDFDKRQGTTNQNFKKIFDRL
jgi:hypothetical protein